MVWGDGCFNDLSVAAPAPASQAGASENGKEHLGGIRKTRTTTTWLCAEMSAGYLYAPSSPRVSKTWGKMHESPEKEGED